MCPINGTNDVGDMSQGIEVTFHCGQILHLREYDVAAHVFQQGRQHSGQHVSAHQKKAIWPAIAKDVRTLGVHHRRSTHCRKRWEDLGRWSKKTAEAQLGWPPNVRGVPIAP
ncbi:hypothetical protein NDU88_002110 [Pleurodeles waltl]|uniref:Myb/SANT-like DNA-binding domain-containing protein n=1 Tax=Pleurodeles waltl TaxID=8319 RepID=A0AAV7W3M8_PLEWA|nr:hypothetical protein NDU88_002110 [Pleurodeles waltl]